MPTVQAAAPASCICSEFERFHHADSTGSSTSALASQAEIVFAFFFVLAFAFRSTMSDGESLRAHEF
jgi:hypothetical protein